MPNIKSAKKRVKVIETKTLRNQMIKSGVKTSIRRFHEAAMSGDKAKAADALKNAIAHVDKAAAKGVMHKNNASRKKSQLALAYNKIG